MKLNIGNNLRKLRRAADMTQDELAAKLGVTFQTVSRWENGGSYPDIEFLPAIADVFAITVDHLLDRDRDSKRSHLCMLIDDRLRTAVRERDPETACEVLRELRRDLRQYAEYDDLPRVWNILRCYEADAPPEVLAETRELFEVYLQFQTDLSSRWNAVWAMSVIEDETKLGDFLKRYCTDEEHKEFTVERMLSARYHSRGEQEKAEKTDEFRRYTALRQVFLSRDPAAAEKNLAFLHLMNGITPAPEHPVTGDGSADLWADLRLYMAYVLAEHAAETGDTERTFALLTDAIELREKLMPEGKVRNIRLTGTPSVLPTLTLTAACGYSDYGGKRNYELTLFHGRRDDPLRRFYLASSVYDLQCFEKIRESVGDDPRYEDLRTRLDALLHEEIPT